MEKEKEVCRREGKRDKGMKKGKGGMKWWRDRGRNEGKRNKDREKEENVQDVRET